MRGVRVPPYVGLVAGVTAVSTASTLIRLAQVEAGSLAIAAWRLTFAALVLAPFALAMRREELRGLSRREWGLVAAAGLLLTVHFATWISSLALTTVAASVVLVSTNPLFVGVASHLFFGERLNRRVVAGLAVAVAGSMVIGLGDLGQGRHQVLGDVLALGGAVSGAGYFLIGRQLRGRLSLLGYVFPVYAVSAVALMAVALVSGVRMGGFASSTWVWIVLMALGPQIVGHSSLNWSLRHLTATYVTLVVLVEPVGSALLAWAILGEVPTVAAAVGGALILAGIGVASRATDT